MLGCPGTGFEGHELASSCHSRQFPAATLGIRLSSLGFPLLDSGDRGRQAVRGSVRELASAPSWPPHLSSSHPVTAKPGTEAEITNTNGWGSSLLGDMLSGGGLAASADLTVSEEGRGKSVGLPLSTGYLEKQNIINIPILSFKKKSVLNALFP